MLLMSLYLSDLYGINHIDRTFYSVNDIHGVSQRAANSIIEDKEGFMWVSSRTGVLRLTEDDCRSYLLPYNTPDILTIKLTYGVSGLIAYSNNGQFFKYDHLSDQFNFYFDLRPMLSTNRITIFNVLVDDDGVLFIPTNYGLYRYNNEGELDVLTERYREVRNLDWYDKHIFVGRSDGILILNKEGDEKAFYGFDNKLSSLIITKLFYDEEKQRLWIGTHPGDLFYLSMDKGLFTNVVLNDLPLQPILAMEMISDSTLMLGYDGQGLWEIARDGSKILNVYREDVDNPSSLHGNGVYDIFKDSNERVWVCTYSGGASFFEQSALDVTQIKHIINKPNSLVNNVVNDIHEDDDGNIWFATNNGISRWHVETNKWEGFLNNETGQAKVVLSIFGDSRGKIWAGTWSEGVFVLDGKTGRKLDHFFFPGEEIPDFGDFIFDITEDSEGDLWIVGVVEDVLRYSREEKRIIRYGHEPAYVIKELNSEEMLLGCSYGLVLLNKSSGEQEIILNDYIINDFLILNDIIWCCTSGGGLIRLNLNDKSYIQYTIESGLVSNFVNSVFYVDNYLWLGTENGLCRFSPENNEFINYSSIIQLANASFNQGAGFFLNNGNLIFGTNQGAIMFNPYSLKPKQAEGKLFIQDIIISGRTIRDKHIFDLKMPVDSLQTLILPYDQRTISLELIPKGLSASESKISWKFNTRDNVWSIPSSNRLLTFANLPSNKYELKIRMYNNSLSEIIDERSLFIRINPPFWGSWWFYILVVIIIMGVLYFSFRYHIGLIQKLHNEDKIRFFANTTHEIRTALTLIGGPIDEIKNDEKLSKRGEYYLSLAREQVNNLLKIATQLLDFQKYDKKKEQLFLENIDVVELIKQRIEMFESFAARSHVKLSFKSDLKNAFTALDQDKMVQVFDNLISNAIKYSYKNGEVDLHLYNEKNNWVLTVADQGVGISPVGQKQLFKEFYRSDNVVNSKIMGSGIGLLIVKNYVENHKGKISFSSKESKGTIFKIEIPYRYEQDKLPELVGRESLVFDNDTISGFDAAFSNKDHLKTKGDKDTFVLIVEDNDSLREFMSSALEEDYTIGLATNGREAWEVIKKEMPDLVISDIMMPEIDGFELCRLIKSTYETAHIPVILLTGLTEKAAYLHGIGLGADAYLTKPFDMNLLRKRISSIVLNRELIRKNALELKKDSGDEKISGNELNDQFVKKALEVVKLNISNPSFGKDLFAGELNVSSSLLYKKIKSLTDLSPTDFIKSIRLKEALELLKSGKYTVTEVSELCGFSSVGYFGTVFKKYYEKSPSEVLEG